MEEKGAVFVFDKPDDGWENLEFSDAARLDVVPGSPRTGTTLDQSYLGAQFGKAIAISANGDTIIAGSFVKDKTDANTNLNVSVATNAGRLGNPLRYSVLGEAQIFVRPSGGWTNDSTPDRILRAELSKDTALHSFQSFGEFVDISPDGNTVAVTASGYAVPALKALPTGSSTVSTTPGYVYIWEKPASGWGASVSQPQLQPDAHPAPASQSPSTSDRPPRSAPPPPLRTRTVPTAASFPTGASPSTPTAASWRSRTPSTTTTRRSRCAITTAAPGSSRSPATAGPTPTPRTTAPRCSNRPAGAGAASSAR